MLKVLIENGKQIVAVVGPDNSELRDMFQKDDLLKNCNFVRQENVNDENLSNMQKYDPSLFIVAGFLTFLKKTFKSPKIWNFKFMVVRCQDTGEVRL